MVALSATAWAAPKISSKLPANSVKSKQIKDGQVKSVDVADNGLTGTDVDESTLNLPAGPQGATGPQGAAGATGATGPAGTNGTNGSPDTGPQILAKLLGVDGSGSGLDADTLDGQSSSAFSAVGHTHNGGDIVDGTLTDADISNTAAIAGSKLATQMGVLTGRVNNPPKGVDVFVGASGTTGSSAAESDVTTLSPATAMTASGFAVRLTQPPGGSQNWNFNLSVNGADVLGCGMPGPVTTCDSAPNTAPIPAGSTLSLHIQSSPGATPADVLFGWQLR